MTSNRDAIGAEVKVRLKGQTLWRSVMPTHGYLSQSELPVTFGLEHADKADSVEIRWPNGKVQPVPQMKIDALNVIREQP